MEACLSRSTFATTAHVSWLVPVNHANESCAQSTCICAQVSVESYPEWIQLVAEFTIKSLNSWQWASASIYYLMGLWSRLVSSMPYLKGDAPSYMETCVPKIARAYITSRCQAADSCTHLTGPCLHATQHYVSADWPLRKLQAAALHDALRV